MPTSKKKNHGSGENPMKAIARIAGESRERMETAMAIGMNEESQNLNLYAAHPAAAGIIIASKRALRKAEELIRGARGRSAERKE